MNIRIDKERPIYVSSGRIVDENNNFVAGTKTKEQAVKIVESVKLINDLIKKYTND